VAIAARICPNDVRLTLEQAIPGGMSLEDYSLMREVIAAIREGMLSADQMQRVQYFSMCWRRCRTVRTMPIVEQSLLRGAHRYTAWRRSGSRSSSATKILASFHPYG
jgi:hypothetical protein